MKKIKIKYIKYSWKKELTKRGTRVIIVKVGAIK